MEGMITWILITCAGLVGFMFCLAVCLAARRPVPLLPAEAILAIDDDPAFLSATKMFLETEDYAVHAVANPKEGIEFFANHQSEVGLVLLDYLMPEMTGDRVFERLRAIDPKVPVLWVSGHVERISRENLGDDFCDYLAKPFRMTDLVQKVQTARAA
jgi:CheY-like chemotaxis protein